jgi:hypothetical protein
MFIGQSGMQGAEQLWKARAPMEYKFFLWLAFQTTDWLVTRIAPFARSTMKGSTTCSLDVFTESPSRPLVDFGVLNENLIK